MKKKCKIFLGAFINNSNAQNLNCLTLAKYLDKDKLDSYDFKYILIHVLIFLLIYAPLA